jgi:hypothetical protein
MSNSNNAIYQSIQTLLDNNIQWDNLSDINKSYARQFWNKSSWSRELNKRIPQKSYIFLDIDGVVHAANSCGGPADNVQLLEKMSVIAKLATNTNSTIVISSNWRGKSSKMTEIKNKLQDEGYMKNIDMLDNNYLTNFDGLLLLPDNENTQQRSLHIKNYLSNHSHSNFVIIDDTSKHISLELIKNYVKTNPKTGITQKIVDKIHIILNNS